MPTKAKLFNERQLAFKELFVGTLIYAVVLGFFNDYTSIVYAKGFSTIFFASIVLELLTYLALMLKSSVVSGFKGKEGSKSKLLMGFSVWLIMFLSKFVFIWVIDIIFGNNININGFFGILILVLCVTVVHKVADLIFIKLGDTK